MNVPFDASTTVADTEMLTAFAIDTVPLPENEPSGFFATGTRMVKRPSPAGAVASPMGQQRRWEGAVGDQPDMRAAIAATPGANLTVPDNYPLVYSPIAQSWKASTAYLTSPALTNDVKLAILRNDVIWHNNSAANPRMIFHPNMSRQIAAVYQPGGADPGGAAAGGGAVESNVPAITNPPLAMNPDGVGSTVATRPCAARARSR